jgi:hypothetical protein
MNETELKILWQTANQKLESSLKINQKNAEEITKLKVQNFLSSMKPIKKFTLIVGIIWVAALGTLLVNLFFNSSENVSIFFMISASIQGLLTAIAIAVYIYQLDLINKIDFGEPVIEIQSKLSKLKVSTLNVTRILFLQLPVWTTFYWNDKMFSTENILLWIIQGIITLSFIYLAIWLFINIKYENRNKKWIKLIFRGKEWQPILESMELMNQFEETSKY